MIMILEYKIITRVGSFLFGFPFLSTMFMLTGAGFSSSDSAVETEAIQHFEIPPIAADAYFKAASQAPKNCKIDDSLLAGIAYVESKHGTMNGSTIEEDGDVKPPIIGIPLNGTNRTRVIKDTDLGEFDGDKVYDRAVGAFQFIPTSWQAFKADGNGDNLNDPHNIYDSALAAVNHLCEKPKDLTKVENIEVAVLAYNEDRDYVAQVLSKKKEYETNNGTYNADFMRNGLHLTSVNGIKVHSSVAANVKAMLASAKADGVYLSGWGYRSNAVQIELRKKHCGTSYYAIYQKPSGSCNPPTARPGKSQHEKGLAIDFKCNGGRTTRQSSCFRWLKRNAGRYGFYNLPSEPWHWSTTGR